MKKTVSFVFFVFFYSDMLVAQSKSDLGSWYMYFGNYRFSDSPWAIHGEFQYRNHNIVGDLEQLALRTGLQYNLENGLVSFLAGYGSFTSQAEGDSQSTFHENRVFQEVILRQRIDRVGLLHRFRYEQRWIQHQEFRTRFRYALIVNVPLSHHDLRDKGAWYVQISDEIFLNGETTDRALDYFDRNRLYLGLGKRLAKNLALQVGFLEQTTATLSKSQLQFSLHHQLFSR